MLRGLMLKQKEVARFGRRITSTEPYGHIDTRVATNCIMLQSELWSILIIGQSEHLKKAADQA